MLVRCGYHIFQVCETFSFKLLHEFLSSYRIAFRQFVLFEPLPLLNRSGVKRLFETLTKVISLG